jgi:azurin
VLVSTPHQAAVAAPAHLLAFASEYRIGTSRAKAPAGVLIAQLQNNGQDDHDLAVRTSAGRIVATTKVVHHGGLGQLRVRLKPGRYQLVCTLAGHEALGMRALLVVRARRAV